MTMNNLFANINTATNNTRGLTGTAQLVSVAGNIVERLINQINSDAEQWADKLLASQTDNDAMDNLLDELDALDGCDFDFMYEISDATLDNMLKSQQSKRSRCKSKAMTLDNYKSMMNAAIAEKIIRMVSGKTKHAGGYSRGSAIVDYTPAQLEAFADDQDALRREIRNIQSKKSIMKSKVGFDESSERWLSLCKAEEMLKDLRVGKTSTTVVKVDETKQKLDELLNNVDIKSLHAADSKALLEQIAQMMAAEQSDDAEDAE